MTQVIDGKQYLTVAEAAKFLDLSEGRIRQFIFTNRIPHRKFGRRYTMFLIDDLQEFKTSKRPTGIHRTPKG